ncbi:hypothetical protein CYMTET_19800 [Cymbomonas tetramitiformis]|uniref:Cell division cycle protein 123 n=1 Tax=Cymbomonas tetramitiformis TaxID=36881 RepID=A0AAE0G5X8_9CHLO|nr:hypothetical protein CYMTET_19800 [Cymbomonas tetramitiformis]
MVTAMRNEEEIPAPLVADVINCSFKSWGPQFKIHAFRSQVIDLPQDFTEHLRADGVFLPEDNQAIRAQQVGDDDSDDWNDDNDADNTDLQGDEFLELKEAVRSAIGLLDGEVIPKLNWSCPKDATWVNCNSLKCTNPDEVFLLLKCSDTIAHDLDHAFDNCADALSQEPHTVIPPQLVLKKWYDVRPSMQFRCFVHGKELLGMSQRDTADFYAFLLDMREQLAGVLIEFFDCVVQPAFPSQNYTYDVYVTQDMRVKLMDFNPYGGETLPLLFTWTELEKISRIAVKAAAHWPAHQPLALDPHTNSSVGADVAHTRLEPATCASSQDAAAAQDDVEAVGASMEATNVDKLGVGMSQAAEDDFKDWEPQLRLVETQQMIQPGLRLGVPLDLYDTSDGSAMAEFYERCKDRSDLMG